MKPTVEDIISALGTLQVLERKSDLADKKYELHPDDEKVEMEFDKAYRAAWDQKEVCAKMIESFSDSKIDIPTARRMLKPDLRQSLIAAIYV